MRSTTKNRSKIRVALSALGLSAILGVVTLGGCGVDMPAELLEEAQQPLTCLSSPPTNACITYTVVGGQWCPSGFASSGAACDVAPSTAGRCDGNGACVALWEAGSFRSLEDGNPGALTLLNFVTSLSHGTTFVPFNATRQAAFDTFVDAMVAAANAGLTNANAPDWCNVADLAENAGYRVTRFFDSTMGRWLVYANDTDASGHGYFFFNPEPRRALVLEAPHIGSPGSVGENDTQREGVFLFEQLAARALLLNGADRCSGGTTGTCGGTYTGDVCGSGTAGTTYQVSDVAHATANAFQRFHARLNTVADNRFVQLHGRNISNKHVTANDGRNDNAAGTNSMANDFKTQLEALDASNSFTTLSCQDGTSTTFCGETNVQGRLTAQGTANGTCFFQGTNGTRFLHLEQGTGFLAGGVSTPASKSWPEMANALRPITTCLQAASCNAALPAQPSALTSLACSP